MFTSRKLAAPILTLALALTPVGAWPEGSATTPDTTAPTASKTSSKGKSTECVRAEKRAQAAEDRAIDAALDASLKKTNSCRKKK
jgi:hypothetical protein